MIDVISVYNDVTLDDANSAENGQISYERFNRLSWRAELKFIDWLTGDAKGGNPPPPLNQKNRDFLDPFVKSVVAQTVGGFIDKPTDYYTWDNGSLVTTDRTGCDDEEAEVEVIRVPVEILTTDKFNGRSITYIESLKPSLTKPIIRNAGDKFEVLPKDLGTVQINYVRLPVKAEIQSVIDPEFNNEVPGHVVNYDFPESARNHLIYFIVQEFSLHTREKSIFEMNTKP